jgi:hypothetical protein
VFPVLKQLELKEVRILEDSLRSLLSGCHVLESLHLDKTYGFRYIQLISPSLRSIGVSVGIGEMVLEELVEDTPCLERLLLPMLLCRLHIRVTAAPKLEVLGWLPDFRPRLNPGIDVPRVCYASLLFLSYDHSHVSDCFLFFLCSHPLLLCAEFRIRTQTLLA